MDFKRGKNFIKRDIFANLRNHLQQKEITFIIGARQVGKTTLMQALQEYLGKQGEKTLSLSLDFESDKPYFASQNKLIRRMELEFGQRRGFVFIDEIQRKENAGIFLKGIYDKSLPYKLIVSGSGSVELKEKIHESLAGRKLMFEVLPVSFKEFINYQTQYRYSAKISEYLEMEKEKAQILFNEYLNFGGYPRVVLAPTAAEKRHIINEIYQSYLEKDINLLLNINKTDAFTALVKILASQAGQLLNYSELSHTLGLSLPTIKKYIWYLEKTFIIEQVTPFYKNMRKEITKSPIIYFRDLGLRNWIIGSFGELSESNEMGLVFQNFVFNTLKAATPQENWQIHFWRTKDGAEVDFVVTRGKKIIPLEVKYQSMNKPQIPKSLVNFIIKYHPAKAFIVNLTLQAHLISGNTEIHFIPFYELERILI